MIKWKRLALGIFSVASTLAYSQQTVTLKQAIEFALQNKADALKAKLDITNADAKILEAKAGTLLSAVFFAITFTFLWAEVAPVIFGRTSISSPLSFLAAFGMARHGCL